jgi:hypothetical protein
VIAITEGDPTLRREFTVGGRRVTLDPEGVAYLLDGVAADPVHKHYVVVGDRRFPVKQALSVAANLPASSFISTEASRVLRSLGFEVGRTSGGEAPAKNESEILFEEYLSANGLGSFKYEPEIPGIGTRPDFVISRNGQTIIMEAKQFEATPADFRMAGGAYDPYAPIREKIDAGRKKFRELKQFPCCLVLYNQGKPLVNLKWTHVYGAMLGALGIRMPFDTSRGEMRADQAIQGFWGGGGKMRKYAGSEPVAAQNQTISAVVVLERMRLGQRRFLAETRARENNTKQELSLTETLEAVEKARGTESDVGLLQTRVVVCENPDAKKPLDRDLFVGRFDERYGGDGGAVVRVFCGEEIRLLEELESSVGLRFPQSPTRAPASKADRQE